MLAAATNEAAQPLTLSTCPVCQLPAHASETDDLDRCGACRPQSLPLIWRVLDTAYGLHDYVLVEVRHLPFDEASDSYGTEHLTTILSCEVDDDGSQVHYVSGPALCDVTEDEFRYDLERWWELHCDRYRAKPTRHCADRMTGEQSTCVENTMWDRARTVIAKLEAEIAAKRSERAA